MHIHSKNVNTAFAQLVAGIHHGTVKTKKRPSRNGEVLMVEEPVVITYQRPREKVLFNQARDANPFMMLYESLWMLAGRNEVAPLAYYTKQFKEYSDDGETLNGAYGYRWRRTKTNLFVKPGPASEPNSILWDQFKILANHLKSKPESRRAVLQMWNVEDDLLKIDSSRDVCCNTNVYFSVNDARLCMTVCNRSNDLVWGTFGSDYVNLAFLQEYMAARLGLEVGVYNQFTNNLHVYTNNWKPKEWLNDVERDRYSMNPFGAEGEFPLVDLMKNLIVFEEELPRFVEWNSKCHLTTSFWDEPFFNLTAQPLLNAFHCHKLKNDKVALDWLDKVKADDWRIAGRAWIERRIARKKHAVQV